MYRWLSKVPRDVCASYFHLVQNVCLKLFSKAKQFLQVVEHQLSYQYMNKSKNGKKLQYIFIMYTFINYTKYMSFTKKLYTDMNYYFEMLRYILLKIYCELFILTNNTLHRIKTFTR